LQEVIDKSVYFFGLEIHTENYSAMINKLDEINKWKQEIGKDMKIQKDRVDVFNTRLIELKA
jgi:hypothetical protein